MNKKLVVFAPHPDDETFGCGGTIAKRVSEGWEVSVVIMTDGRYAFLNVLGIGSNPTPEELKEIRRGEAKRAARILGVPEGNLVFLNFVDGTLKANKNNAEEKIVKLLSETRPDEVYFPYRLDGHPDHSAAYKIVKNATAKLRISPVCYQYTITHKFARFGRFIDPFLISILGYKKVHVDISKFLHAKQLAIMEFKSELMAISAKRRKSVIEHSEKFQKKWEIFYMEKNC